jgi:hypothetical protein
MPVPKISLFFVVVGNEAIIKVKLNLSYCDTKRTSCGSGTRCFFCLVLKFYYIFEKTNRVCNASYCDSYFLPNPYPNHNNSFYHFVVSIFCGRWLCGRSKYIVVVTSYQCELIDYNLHYCLQ